MTYDEFTAATNGLGSPGVCLSCGDYDEYAGCEPDAEHYECSACGEKQLFGLDQALLLGKIQIVD
jgi:hypothetical protein